jgi:lysophospholipase L1-like esterase
MSPTAAQIAAKVNQQLELKASMNQDRMTFVAFPFPFVQGGENFSPDALHLSMAGYQELGKRLAPVVQFIFKQQQSQP